MEQGWGVWEDVYSAEECALLIDALGLQEPTRGGQRNMLDHPACISVARDPRIRSIVEEALSDRAFAVRAIAFDKSLEENWALAMHQDTKIAVMERIEVEGFTSWSEKDRVVHVKPPVSVLEQQIAVRVHVDPCDLECGPVHVLPGTHANGFLLAADIAQAKADVGAVALTGGVGSVAVFRSLLLHGSSRMTRPARRRTLHIEFCDVALPTPLVWRWRV